MNTLPEKPSRKGLLAPTFCGWVRNDRCRQNCGDLAGALGRIHAVWRMECEGGMVSARN